MVACNEKLASRRTGGVAIGRPRTPFSGVACNARSAVDRPSLGTWTSQDLAQFINGANTYRFVMGNPVNAVDPGGETFWGWVGPGAVIGGIIVVWFVLGVDVIVDAGG